MFKKTIASVAVAGLTLLGASVGATSAQALPSTTSWTDAGLQEMFKIKGHVTWSADGLGINSGQTGTIQAKRPSKSSVIAAFLMVSSNNSGGRATAAPTDVKVNGAAVTFTHTATETTSGFGFTNYLADVTSNVKDKLDNSPVGNVNISVDNGALQLDPDETGDFITGDELLVVYNTPDAPLASVILEFGTSATTGDTFSLDYPALTSPQTSDLEMSIGDAYSYGDGQNSTITVNGQTLTDQAGNFDDCSAFNPAETDSNNWTCADPALITVGGVGDSTANPTPGSTWTPTADDELYSLAPFVNVGDTAVSVNTLNGSNDDNLFSAFFYLKNIEVTGAADASTLGTITTPGPDILAATGGNGSDLALQAAFGLLLLAGGAFLVRRLSA